jgi:osmoprotectant transport system ATP-binding protein
VLGEGGRLLQYAPPAELLSRPVSDTVADFVGADRGIRRLAVTPVRDAVRPLGPGATTDGLPVIDAGATLYDALAAMLAAGAAEVVVVQDGRPVGLVGRADVFGVPEKEAEATV